MICSDRATAESPGSYNKTFCTTYKWCTQRHALERAQSLARVSFFFSFVLSLFHSYTRPRRHFEMAEKRPKIRVKARECARSTTFGESQRESCLWMAMRDKIIEERRVSLTSINYYFSFMSSTNKTYKQDASLSISSRSGVSPSAHKEQARYLISFKF